MLNNLLVNGYPWNNYQQPIHAPHQHSGLMRLLAALDSGWQIISPAEILTCHNEFGGQLLQVYLGHPTTSVQRELILPLNREVEQFLGEENIAILR